MSYHKLPNITETLEGDVVGKIRKVIGLKDFLNREYNCNSTTKVKGTCSYWGECRSYFILYKFTCRKYLSVYVGNTEKKFKKRMEQHFQDVAQKVQCNKNSDTFADHFIHYFDEKPTPQ